MSSGVVYRLTYEKNFEVPLPPGVEERGSYNFMPKPFREATQDEYIHHTATTHPDFMEYRQVSDAIGTNWIAACWIYWYPRQAWAVFNPREWHSRRPEEGDGYDLVWDDPIRYFKIGCDHKYITIERPNRWTDILECERCQARFAVHE